MTNPSGARNLYICQRCGYGFVTVATADGVTPFTLGCLRIECRGTAHSNFGRRVPKDRVPSVEFFAPANDAELLAVVDEWKETAKARGHSFERGELNGLIRDTREHVKKFGLLHRKVKDAPPPFLVRLDLPPGARSFA